MFFRIFRGPITRTRWWLAGILLLAACETTVPDQRLPEMTFGHLDAITLNVADIQIVTAAANESAAGDAGFKFPVTPEKALLRWAEDRLRAGGNQGTARFTILAAGVTETQLKLDRGITGLFKQEQSDRYDATVEASLEILDNRGFRRTIATARARRSTTIGEEATINERRRRWFDFVEQLIGDFNIEIERVIRRHMVEYIF